MAAPRPTSRQSIYARQSTAGKSLNRQSIAPPGTLSGGASSSSASSHNGPPLQYDENGHVLLSPAQQRMLDKQQEWEAFLRVNRQTEQQHQYVSQLGEKNELLVNGNEVIGKVVSNWQNVFRATHLAMASLATQADRGIPEQDTHVSTFVRIPTAAKRQQEKEDAS